MNKFGDRLKNARKLKGLTQKELADMIKFQRAYEASAKLFSTVNDLFGVVINMV